MSSNCISCKKPVRARQQGLQCDGCLHWQHRTCETGISLSDYRTAVRTASSIDWRCVNCMSESSPIPVAESTPVDMDISANDSAVIESVINDSADHESTVYEPVADPAAFDESSIFDPPAQENAQGNDSSFAVTFEILQNSTTKGRPKLVDSRGYCYNVKRRRPNATDWQCTIRRKVNIVTETNYNNP